MGGSMPSEYYAAYYRRNKVKRAEQSKQWAQDNLQSNRAYHADYYRKNWATMALKRAKNRALRDGLPFALTADDVVIPSHCPVLGIPIIIGGECGSPNSPSLDRYDNALGYVRGNVFVISKRANTIKSDATAIELRAVLAYVEKS